MILWLLLIQFIPGAFLMGLPRIDVGTAIRVLPPCEGHEITIIYEGPLEIQNQYTLNIPILEKTKILILKFDSAVTLELRDYPNKTKINVEKLAAPRNSYRFTFGGDVAFWLGLQVFGPASGTMPYLESVLRDYYEICRNPKAAGYLDDNSSYEARFRHIVDRSCGRRKEKPTQRIVHGESTGPGDWPWHVAILRLDKSTPKYICGGTLLTKTLVLTAAHCASTRGNAVIPDILSVHLGKHHLIGGDLAAQEREVFQVILHTEFDGLTQDNDIALLKLKSEAIITDFVQPACLWNEMVSYKLPDSQSIFGTVAGWGFNHHDGLSATLQKTTIPIVPELTCYKSNPTFFHHRLNDKKFCAGLANGTSPCNGDSGGGFMIFVPDESGDTDTTRGGWYVRGIVSIAPRRSDAFICDPYQYIIFTDVEKYQDWLLEYME